MSYYWETIPSTSYFASCSDAQKNATSFSECNDDPLYPVDVWLYDHRVKDTINNEDFAVVFPDKAILEGQFVEWPIGGRKVTPAHAIEILKSVGPAVAGFERLHEETDCVADIDVSSTEHRQSGEGVKGAGAGGYACFDDQYHNMKYFKGCAYEEEGDTTMTDEPAEDTGDSSTEEGDAATTKETAEDAVAKVPSNPTQEKTEPVVEDEDALTMSPEESSASGRYVSSGAMIAILVSILTC